MVVDLVFPVVGTEIPIYHGYSLYGALSRILPFLHDGSLPFGLGLITGRYTGRGTLQLEQRSSVMRLRLEQEAIPRVLQLAGARLEIDRCRIQLGTPHVEALRPAPVVGSHFVNIKNADEPDLFLTAARKKLDEIGVGGAITIPTVARGPRQGEPRRQVIRVKRAVLVGFPMIVSDLSPEESIRLQGASNFAKRHMGAAFFLPMEKPA